MKIKNQVAIITGGASGLGKACAELLTQKGAKAIIWDRQSPQLPLPTLPYVACDVTSIQAVEQALQQTIQEHGIPRILIQCAGILSAMRMVGKSGLMPASHFKQVVEVNLIGTFQVMQLVSAHMMLLPLLEEERGVIINTASIAAFEGQIGQVAYSASKGGVVGMTLPAARELASQAIRVLTIAPGLMETPMLQSMTAEVQERLIQTFIFPKRLGKTIEFAALAAHIIQNTLMNGEVIRLDGSIRLPAK